MRINEEGLKRQIGSYNLIGCYTKNKDGHTCFTDIRGGEGNLVKNPLSSEYDLNIEYDGHELCLGTFYSFAWRLNNITNRIEIASTPTKVDNKEFLSGLFNARLRLSGSNLEQFNKFQETIFNEVTGAQYTYIYELLQNANDYPYNDEHVNVKFILTNHYLFFMHSGSCFNLRNVVGISSINQGEKKKNTETIGYKGIGFKTVFVNNDYVYLRSGNWSLRFDRKYSEEKFSGDCPWALMPIPTDISELDDEAREIISKYDMRVQFALKHRTDASKNIEQLDKVFCDNQILLFIPHVYQVEVIVDGKLRHFVEKDNAKWIVSDYTYKVPIDLKEWVKENTNTGDKIPEKFKDIDNVRISFAVARERNKLLPVENARVYNYLPTELMLGFSFLFNADFVPNGSRSGLHDVNWNDRIMEQCGFIYADWWVSFLQKENEYDMNSVFDILPQFESRDKYAQLFLRGFSNRIQKTPCIPTLRGGYYHLVKLEDALYDKVGFISCDNSILTDEEFYEFSDTTGCIPHPSVRCNENLYRLLKKYDCSIAFGESDLAQLCFEDDFQEWLVKDDHDYKFLGFLLGHDYIMNYWNYPIFLTEEGKIDKAEKLYYDIDDFIEDIYFLSEDLPRLNVSLREQISTNYNTWDSNKRHFKQFNDYTFIRSVFANFSKYADLFAQKENSIHFIHFLAVTNCPESTPPAYPFFIEDDTYVTTTQNVYQKNSIGEKFVAHSWINKEWVKFLANDYFAADEERVRLYLSSNTNIRELTESDCYKHFISDDARVPLIADAIKEEVANVDFFKYLLSIQDVVSNFSPAMRLNYNILTTDGKNELWTPITKTIFWQDKDWEQMCNKVWMPEKCCLAIKGCYFIGLTDEESEQLKTFFSTKQIVQKFSIPGMYQSLRTRLADVFARITTKEISKEFLNFLFYHRSEIFKSGQIDVQFKKIPILCKDTDSLVSIEGCDNKIYIPSQDALELYNQPWFNRNAMKLCDDYYVDLFDGSERIHFFKELELKVFEKVHYLRAHLLIHLNLVKENLSNRDCNVSFHRYISNVHEELSDKDLENVKGMPIFISSTSDENGQIVEKSNNHFLPSALVSDIIAKDLIPINILESIHPDYIKSEKDRGYFKDKLGNVEIDEEEFFSYLAQGSVFPIAIPYLKEQKRNIRFWRWVCDSKEKREIKGKLSEYPMLAIGLDDNEPHYALPRDLCISGVYTNIDGLEQFISDNVDAPEFVSPLYIEKGVERDWNGLFKALKVTVEYKEIVFKNILPNLAKYEETNIISILAKYVDVLKQKLSEKDEKTCKCFNNLLLKCRDGIYRTPKDVVVSGTYFDIADNPFPDIEIGYLVSEEYLANFKEDDVQRRNVIKLIVAISDAYNIKRENATQLRNEKLKYYAKHQDYYINSDAHYSIIGELSRAYNSDAVGISELLKDLGSIKLFTTKGKFVDSHRLYLSTVYNPECQYMANGITELDFVSEKYNKFCPNGLKRLWRRLGLFDGFTEANLRLLRNEQFALYFWEEYAPNNETFLKDILTVDKLRSIACIPTSQGMKKPCEVYDYRNPQLQKIVLRLKDGSSKLPAVELPKWTERIGMRGRLYLLDCLEYLTLNSHDYRREVIKWVIDTPDETIIQCKNSIADYCASAKWFNGAKEWVPLSNLVALEWNNETLKGNFGGNAYVCNPSYMPESQTDYNRLCKIFGIKILTNIDFSKQKSGNCKRDTEAIHEISKRLPYLAFKSGRENWEELYVGYKDRLLHADVSTCERILYSYNENIYADLQVYAEEASALWYVKTWRGPMFLAVLEWIMKKLEIKENFDKNFLQRLFLNDFNSFIEQEEGGSLPPELLQYLDDTDRAGIKKDENINAEEFIEDNNESNSLSDVHKSQANSQIKQRLNLQVSKTETESDDINSCEGVSENAGENTMTSSEDESSERKRRSDYGDTHQKHETSLDGNNQSKKASKLDSSDTSHDDGSIERTLYTERLKEKWEKQKSAAVQKPHSTKPSYQDTDVFKDGGNTSGHNERFFDDTVNTKRYTQEKSNADEYQPSSCYFWEEGYSNKYKAVQEELDKVKDMEDLEDAMSKTPKYTFLWFKYLMEKLYNQKNNTATTRNVQIDFREAKVLDDNTIAFLKPNRVVPKWIEHADDMTLHILKDGTSENIEVNLQYFTDDSIWTHYDDASTLEEKVNSADKVRLTANGSYANHIDSLSKQFVKLDLPDDFNMKENLPDCIKYIYGPPGTGKTTKLIDIIQNILSGNSESLDILVLTPTNKAADVIASRLDAKDKCSQYVYRYGVTENLDYLSNNLVYTRDDSFIDSEGHHVLVTTAARYAYDYLMPNEEIICDHHWDYIIVDEASMMDIVTMAFILFKSTDCHFIISGDPKQIQPVKQNDVQPENIYQMVGLNSFAVAQNDPKVECLNTQYRSIPTIGRLVSDFSYNGLVKPNRKMESQKPLDLGFKISSINFIGFKTELFDNLYGLDAIEESAFHLYSAIFTYEYASYMAKKIENSNYTETLSIGIVCPYKKQADSIRQMIESREISNPSCKVTCGTVHSFQGDECDIMLVVLNPPANLGPNSHVNNQNIINVAMSRAKDYVFFLVPDNSTQGFTMREALGKLAGNDKRIMFCHDLEKIVFDEEDYILHHTHVTCHMPVNVYYEPSALYEVRKDDKAVDIQINEQFR